MRRGESATIKTAGGEVEILCSKTIIRWSGDRDIEIRPPDATLNADIEIELEQKPQGAIRFSAPKGIEYGLDGHEDSTQFPGLEQPIAANEREPSLVSLRIVCKSMNNRCEVKIFDEDAVLLLERPSIFLEGIAVTLVLGVQGRDRFIFDPRSEITLVSSTVEFTDPNGGRLVPVRRGPGQPQPLSVVLVKKGRRWSGVSAPIEEVRVDAGEFIYKGYKLDKLILEEGAVCYARDGFIGKIVGEGESTSNSRARLVVDADTEPGSTKNPEARLSLGVREIRNVNVDLRVIGEEVEENVFINTGVSLLEIWSAAENLRIFCTSDIPQKAETTSKVVLHEGSESRSIDFSRPPNAELKSYQGWVPIEIELKSASLKKVAGTVVLSSAKDSYLIGDESKGLIIERTRSAEVDLSGSVLRNLVVPFNLSGSGSTLWRFRSASQVDLHPLSWSITGKPFGPVRGTPKPRRDFFRPFARCWQGLQAVIGPIAGLEVVSSNSSLADDLCSEKSSFASTALGVRYANRVQRQLHSPHNSERWVQFIGRVFGFGIRIVRPLMVFALVALGVTAISARNHPIEWSGAGIGFFIDRLLNVLVEPASLIRGVSDSAGSDIENSFSRDYVIVLVRVVLAIPLAAAIFALSKRLRWSRA